MIDLLIFDLDGTLIDSAPDIISAVRTFAKNKNIPSPLEHEIRNAIGEGIRPFINKTFASLGINTNAARTQTSLSNGATSRSPHGSSLATQPNLTPSLTLSTDPKRQPKNVSPSDNDHFGDVYDQVEAEFLHVYEQNLLDQTRIYPGVIDFLDRWPGKMAIVTNKSVRHTKMTIAGLELKRFPWVGVFGADAFENKKPHPQPLHEVMKLAKSQPRQTLMIGDGLPDMIAARHAGVHSIACTYGYARTELLMAEAPSLVAQSFHAIEKLIPQVADLAPRSTVNAL
jgi:phosphoglycolate phosphatase